MGSQLSTSFSGRRSRPLRMVCEKCEKLQTSVVCPEPWKDGSNNSVTGAAGRKLGENKLLSTNARVASGNKLVNKCKMCKQRVNDVHGTYCQKCAFAKGICHICGVVTLQGAEFYRFDAGVTSSMTGTLAESRRSLGDDLPMPSGPRPQYHKSAAAAAADDNGWKSGPPVDADAAPAEAPIVAEPVEEPEQQVDERIPEHLRPVDEDTTVDFADTAVLVGNWQGLKKKRTVKEAMFGWTVEDTPDEAAHHDWPTQLTSKKKKKKKLKPADMWKAHATPAAAAVVPAPKQQAAAIPTGFQLDSNTGFYHNSSTGQYYEPKAGIYCCHNEGNWYYYDTAAQDYKPWTQESAATTVANEAASTTTG